jgi:flagella basal body P-ring formation protein FlgA
MRKKVQLMVILTILAWATQTLFHQWGFGQEIAAQPAPGQPAAAQPAPAQPAEKFVPGTARFAAGATLELRGEATVYGPEVKLKQVCRWSARDAGVFGPISDMVLARIPNNTPFQPVSIAQIRTTLHDAGVNLAVVKFSGPTTCTVTRSDVEYNEQEALLQWARAREGQPVPAGERTPATAAKGNPEPAAPQKAAPTSTPTSTELFAPDAESDDQQQERSPVHTLRDALIDDLSVRLRIPVEQLQVTFDPRDEQALRLAEPQFKFNLQPRRARNLGAVSYDVQIVTEAGKSQKLAVNATARAWQQQVVLGTPLAFRQTIRAADVAERRVLVDSQGDDPLLTPQQVIGQQAARELRPGTVMTAKMVQAVPLARTGQFITVTLNRGAVRVKTVARAMEEGSFGQTIKVKNEATRDVYNVVLTGPQEASMGPPTARDANKADVASARTE